VLHHGHGEEDGSRLVVPCNQAEADVIAGFRTGVKGASFDFISSDTSVPYLTTEQLVGFRPAGQFHGMKVPGQNGHALTAPTPLIPADYLACVAVGGTTPLFGLLEHANYQGS
jgi:hypothetical protein